MLSVSGYTTRATLPSAPNRSVCVAVREADGAEVALKQYRRSAAVDPLARSSREFEVLARSAGPRVVRALELTADLTGEPVLVLERVLGTKLADLLHERGSMDVLAFLTLAPQLTRALASVHQGRVLHRGLHPGSFVIAPDRTSVTLIGLSVALPFGAAGHSLRVAEAFEEYRSLGYLAPEQTGRMDRGVDYRSDLYSLGAIFYHMLTGRPPFRGDDALELVHAHLARHAVAPCERIPQLPIALSRLVLKLLEKEPEQRYQRLDAVERDLETCAKSFESSGTIPEDLVLGTTDAPYRPIFKRQLYGRDAELDRLEREYFVAAEYGSRVMHVTGSTGAGKSALLAALGRHVIEHGGTFGSGTFERTRSRPYSGLADALENLVNQWLAEPPELLAARSSVLRQGLGNLAGALARIMPDLRHLVGPLAPDTEAALEASEHRIQLAVQRWIELVGTQNQPLVLAFDDVQWADAESLALLSSLLRGKSRAYCLIVLCHRDDLPEGSEHAEALRDALYTNAVLESGQLALGPLDLDSAARMLADALLRSPNSTRDLARAIDRKLGSLPLLIQSFVELLHDQQLLTYVPEVGWTWELDQVRAADIPDDAVGMLAARLARLQSSERLLLAHASCIGVQFESSWVASAAAIELPVAEQHLHRLCELGLIAPACGGYRFAHDRLREAASMTLSLESARAAHYRIAQRLFQCTADADPSDRAWEIVAHVAHCRDRLSEGERVRLLSASVAAGRHSLSTGAAEMALEQLRTGMQSLVRGDWSERGALAFELSFHGAAAQACVGDYSGSLAVLDGLEQRSLSTIQWAFVAYARTRILWLTRGTEATCAYAESALAHLGIQFPRRPSKLRIWWEVRRTNRMLQQLPVSNAPKSNAPKGNSSERTRAALMVLRVGVPAMLRRSRRIALLWTTWRLEQMLRDGYVVSSVLVLFASWEYWLSGNAARMRGYAEIALASSGGKGARSSESLIAEHNLQLMVYPWLQARRTVLDPLRDLAERALEQGHIQLADIALEGSAVLAALSGVPVAELRRISESAEGRDSPRGNLFASIELLTDAHREPHAEAPDAEPPEFRRPPSAEVMTQTCALWMMVGCIVGEYGRVLEWAGSADPFERDPGTTAVVDYCLYRGIAVAARAGEQMAKRRVIRRMLSRDLKQVKRWAENGSDFVHMAQMLEAEIAALRGDLPGAVRRYLHAASAAERAGYLHHSALSHERRSALLTQARRGIDARAALAAAAERYRAWGADAKVRSLSADRDASVRVSSDA